MFILTMLALSNDALAVPPGHAVATYVGVTSTARTGAVGLPQLNADCEALFPRARLCRDMEIVASFPWPVPGVDARVMATESHRIFNDYHAVTPMGLVINVASTNHGPNCSSSASTGGLFAQAFFYTEMLAANGNLEVAHCATAMVTACCAP